MQCVGQDWRADEYEKNMYSSSNCMDIEWH